MRLSTPCPLRLVKVIILPPSPPSFSLYVCASLSCFAFHIKLHLTSISVKETGASGSCPITTQHLLPPLIPAMPPVFYSLQSPFSDLPHPAVPLAFAPSFWQKRLISGGECYTSAHEPTCGFNGPPLTPHAISLDSQLLTGTYLCCVEKTTHNSANQYKTLRKGRGFNQHSNSL